MESGCRVAFISGELGAFQKVCLEVALNYNHGVMGLSFLHWNELVLLIASSATFAHLPAHCKPQL